MGNDELLFGGRRRRHISAVFAVFETLPFVVVAGFCWEIWSPEPAYFDKFGAAVHVCGDNFIIGASGAAPSGPASGAAYVYNVQAGMSKLTAHDGTTNDFFGCAVAITTNCALVGAIGNNAARGAVYVYSPTGTSWGETAKIIPNDATSGDCFGGSLGIGSNVFIASSRDINNGTNSGAAYIYRNSGASWLQEGKLVPFEGQPDDRFGACVAMSGDLAAVGAPGDGQRGI